MGSSSAAWARARAIRSRINLAPRFPSSQGRPAPRIGEPTACELPNATNEPGSSKTSRIPNGALHLGRREQHDRRGGLARHPTASHLADRSARCRCPGSREGSTSDSRASRDSSPRVRLGVCTTLPSICFFTPSGLMTCPQSRTTTKCLARSSPLYVRHRRQGGRHGRPFAVVEGGPFLAPHEGVDHVVGLRSGRPDDPAAQGSSARRSGSRSRVQHAR